MTALMYAVNDNVSCLERLILRGADVNAKSDVSDSAIVYDKCIFFMCDVMSYRFRD